MPVKAFNPYTPSRRYMTVEDFSDLTQNKPKKALVYSKRRSDGRNNNVSITMRRRGGGSKKKIRIIDFRRDKRDIQGKVVCLEYDPNRSARIALISYADGEFRYILAPTELKAGDSVASGENVDIKPGNSLPLRNIPLGTSIHNIEMKSGKGGQLARSAGSFAQLVAKEKGYGHIKLPSGEVRLINLECYATIGQMGNIEHENITIGKAGRSRWMGMRPKVRGVAMNPVDHPHGGGEGKSKGGNHPQSPTGVYAKGFKTRKNKRSTKFILKRRNK